LEQQRIWGGYTKAIAAAWAQGNREDQWLKRWRELLERRSDMEAVGDERGVRAAEAALDRFTGIPYPRVPEATFTSTDTLPEADWRSKWTVPTVSAAGARASPT
jgi:hypothetical protein